MRAIKFIIEIKILCNLKKWTIKISIENKAVKISDPWFIDVRIVHVYKSVVTLLKQAMISIEIKGTKNRIKEAREAKLKRIENVDQVGDMRARACASVSRQAEVSRTRPTRPRRERRWTFVGAQYEHVERCAVLRRGRSGNRFRRRRRRIPGDRSIVFASNATIFVYSDFRWQWSHFSVTGMMCFLSYDSKRYIFFPILCSSFPFWHWYTLIDCI